MIKEMLKIVKIFFKSLKMLKQLVLQIIYMLRQKVSTDRRITFIRYWMQIRWKKEKNINILYLEILKKSDRIKLTLSYNVESNIVSEK